MYLRHSISIYHEYEGGIENIRPRITNWHQEACQVMTKVITRDGFFYRPLTQIMDSFLFTTYNIIYTGKTWKILSENPEYAEMRDGDVICSLQ